MKNIVLLAIMIGSLASANDEAFFAPGTINKVPTSSELTPSNGIKSKLECDKQKGEWLEYKDSNFTICIIPYSDASKLCKTSDDCIGHCIWPLDGKTLDTREVPRGFGICQINDDPDDCGRPHYKNGEIIYFKCD